jgi:hypothetical protein
MEKMDISDDQRCRWLLSTKLSAAARSREPRRLTYLLAVRPSVGESTKTAKRIFRFATDAE